MNTPSVSDAGGVASAQAPLAFRSVIAAVAIAAVGSVMLVALVALFAQALGVPAFHVLQPSAYVPLVVLGVVAGALGWLAVRRAPSPRAVLKWLIPAVLVVSFVPDVLLGMGLLGGESGMTTGGTVTLMIMHVAVAAVAVPTFARLMPVRDGDVRSRGPIL